MKKIIIVLIAFLILVQSTHAQGKTVYLPIIMNNQIENNWRIIKPVASTNYVLNPSAETTGNFAATGSATVSRSTTYQKYGLYSYSVQTGSNGQGISLTLSTLTNSVHFVSFRVRGQLPIGFKAMLGPSIKELEFIEKIDPDWSLYGATFAPAAANGQTTLYIIQQGNGIGNFYLDGIQVEPLSYWTTYIDGDQKGCGWNGVEHASTSTRSGLSTAGGQPQDLYLEYKFFVQKVIGAGASPTTLNMDSYSILPGGELNSIKIEPRQFSFVGKFIASNEQELHDAKQSLLGVLRLSTPDQPIRFRFNGAYVQKEIGAFYQGGLEGDLAAFYGSFAAEDESDWAKTFQFIEAANIQLMAPNPYWYEVGESAILLDTNDSDTFRVVAGRLKSTGQWDSLGPPNAAGTYTAVYAIAEDDTYIYFGGDFLNFDNIANADYIVRWHKQDQVYSALGGGLTDIVRALEIGPDGRLYIGGDFFNAGGVANADIITVWDGTSFAALGNPNSGGASLTYVWVMTFDNTGLLIIGGNFTNLAGIANADFIASWNGTSWSALSTGANNVVNSLAVGIDNILYVGGSFTTIGGVAASFIASWNGSAFSVMGSGFNTTVSALAIAIDGTLYAGGSFTTSGSLAVNYIASWNGTSWSALGSGLSDQVWSLAVGADDVLYVGGQFTSAGGITLGDRIAKWNGYTWAHLDLDLPGSAIAFSILASKFADPVVPQKFDLYIGFDTTGTGFLAGGNNVTNNGNASAFPKIIFERNGGTVVIVETVKNETTGLELLFDYTLLDGERLTIDLAPGNKNIQSTFFGSRFDAVLANSNFGAWSLIPGNNRVTSFVSNPNVALYPSEVTAWLIWQDVYDSYD